MPDLQPGQKLIDLGDLGYLIHTPGKTELADLLDAASLVVKHNAMAQARQERKKK